MLVRVTPQTVLAQAISSSSRSTSRLADLQRQASSGLRIERPSDGPREIAELIVRKVDHARLETDQENVSSATSRLNHSVSQLLQINEGLIRAKQIAIEAPQSQARETLADDIDNSLERALQLANTRDINGYLYSGSDVDTPPFDAVRGANGEIASVSYAGGDRATVVSIGTSASVEVNEAGSRLFGLSDRGTTIFTGITGAKAGVGTDNEIGVQTLQVRHTSTTYSGSSGVQIGVSSNAGDTILGSTGTNTLTIIDTSGDGTSGTISLNGGAPIAFTNGDTDLRIAGAGGNDVFVDTTSITAGFSGTVDITSDGTLSTDGGATSVDIDFTSNQQVVDSRSGQVTNVDSLEIRNTGDEQLDYDGTAGLFESLIQLRNELRNDRGLVETDLQDAFSRRLGDIDRVRDDVLSGVSRQSIQLENLEAIGNHTEELQLQAKQRISEIESADFAEVILSLQAEQNLLQYTYSTVLRALDQNLIDFLR